MCLAVPGQLQRISGDSPLTREGEVNFGGVVRRVQLALLPEAKPGDWLLVHAGIAISVLDEQAAGETLAALRQLEEPAPASDTGDADATG